MASLCIHDLVSYLESFAPLQLAEDWDNVGLLLGERKSELNTALTCLTITPEVVEEAIQGKVDLIISHHPMPFRPLKKITGDSVTGTMILQLVRNGVSVYSPHTSFDSTARGINQLIAERLELEDIQPLLPIDGWTDSTASEPQAEAPGPIYGVGRCGNLSGRVSCRELTKRLGDQFQLTTIKFCGSIEDYGSRVGIACGSAGQFISDAKRHGCDVFITGETSFHTCLEAQAIGISMFLLGHFGSERFAVEVLAEHLSAEFPQLSIKASTQESDPVQYFSF